MKCHICSREVKVSKCEGCGQLVCDECLDGRFCYRCSDWEDHHDDDSQRKLEREGWDDED
jgi:hypothetical protein